MDPEKNPFIYALFRGVMIAILMPLMMAAYSFVVWDFRIFYDPKFFTAVRAGVVAGAVLTSLIYTIVKYAK